MRKLLINSVLFVALVLATYVIGILVLSKVPYKGKPLIFYMNDYYVWKGGDTYEKYLSRDSIDGKEMVFVGSSRAYRGYSPQYFAHYDIESWNLGSHAQSIQNSYLVVKDLAKNHKVKTVILDVSRLAFDIDGMESSIDLITNANRPELKLDILKRDRDIRLVNTYFVSKFNANSGSTYTNSNYIGAGFATKTDSLSSSWVDKLDKLTEENKRHRVIKDYSWLEKTLMMCAKNDQEIVVVHAPVSEFYSKSAQKSFTESISAITKKWNVRYIDLQQVDGLNSIDHFYDNSHLNQAGVNLFNRKLIEELNAK